MKLKLMKSKALTFLTIVTLAFTVAAQKKQFIGYKHKGVVYGQSLPNGAKDLGGSLLSNDNYGVTRYQKGRQHYLWLEKITGRDRDGVPMWVVRDVLELGVPEKNEAVLFGLGSTCTRSGKADQDLIVLAELAKNRKSYKVAKAWRANASKEKFEAASVKGIRCEVAAP